MVFAKQSQFPPGGNVAAEIASRELLPNEANGGRPGSTRVRRWFLQNKANFLRDGQVVVEIAVPGAVAKRSQRRAAWFDLRAPMVFTKQSQFPPSDRVAVASAVPGAVAKRSQRRAAFFGPRAADGFYKRTPIPVETMQPGETVTERSQDASGFGRVRDLRIVVASLFRGHPRWR